MKTFISIASLLIFLHLLTKCSTEKQETIRQSFIPAQYPEDARFDVAQ